MNQYLFRGNLEEILYILKKELFIDKYIIDSLSL